MNSHAEVGSSPAELWDRIARLYDLQLFLEKPALRTAIALAGPRSDDRVLDVGTGTGALLRELARSGTQAAEVVGVDASATMLERARSTGLPGDWELAQVDARRLPFADERFSLVFAAYLLNVLSDEDCNAVLREARRVLALDGRLVVVSPVDPASPLARRPYRWLAELLPHRLPRFFAGIRLLDPEPLIRAACFQPERRRYVSLGYSSVCLLAARNNSRTPRRRDDGRWGVTPRTGIST